MVSPDRAPTEPDAGLVERLLRECLKPEEIAGPPDVQRRRVEELVRWFARFADGSANPKWSRVHAFELAYYVATALSARREAEGRVGDDRWSRLAFAANHVAGAMVNGEDPDDEMFATMRDLSNELVGYGLGRPRRAPAEATEPEARDVPMCACGHSRAWHFGPVFGCDECDCMVFRDAEATERPAQGEAREPDAWLAEVAGAPERSRSFPSQKEATDHIVRCAPGGQPDRLAGRVVPLYRAPTSDHAAGERALRDEIGRAIEALADRLETHWREVPSMYIAVTSCIDGVSGRALASRPHPEEK